MDKFAIDSHKLMYHPDRLAQWLRSRDDWEKVKKVYPIYVEVSSSGACNHRCSFCALDYLGHKTGSLNLANFKKAVREMSQGGVKSIQFGGEGEPLLHPRITDMVQAVKSSGIDVSFTTNGVFLTKEFLKKCLPLVSWIKVSIDAGTPETYQKIHQPLAGKNDLSVVLNNLKEAVKIRKKQSFKCVLGGQMLLLPENAQEIYILAKKLRHIGLDYLVIKSYSQHLKSKTKSYANIDYKKYLYLADKAEKLNRKNFQVIFRKKAMEKLASREKKYSKCRAVPFFWAYLMSNGDLYSCSSFLGDKKFLLGNINNQSFKDIWEGEARKKQWKYFKKNFDIKKCRQNCRMDEANGYLEKIANPPEHVNFI